MNIFKKGRKLIAKVAAGINMSIFSFVVMANNALADSTTSSADWSKVTGPVTKLCNDLRGPALTIVGAVGALYCIILGAKYAKAEEQQEVMKAKEHLKNALVGFILIFILLAAFPSALTALGTYVGVTI